MCFNHTLIVFRCKITTNHMTIQAHSKLFSAFYTNSTILEEKVQYGAMGDEARCNGRWSTLQRHMHRCEF